MRSVQLDINGPPTGAGLRNQQHTQDNQKRLRDGSSADGQRLSNEDESRINKNVYDGRIEAQPPQHMLQKQPQGFQVLPGQVVCWERFLPLRSLKVLLVENDDSTRHIVSALLRNCSYEVTPVANGFEAWNILEDLTNHIDLVLTEVDMPSLSGIGLLSKIMNHRTCNNIPVIMMSSNDSMGTVFTCLSKGATDFLVKPIRKNELRNLWQHVWRKCHSSSGSGSGSESGIRAQKSTKSKSVEGLSNDTDSNDEDDNGSIGLNARDGSDNGSGTQTSWSKRAMEINSPQPMSPWGSQADPPDSTCAQVIHSRAEVIHNTQGPPAATRKRQKMDNKYDNVDICKDLESGTSKHSDLQLKGQCHNVMNTTMGTEKEKPIDLESEGYELEKGKIDLNDEAPTDESLNADNTILQVDNIGNEVPNHLYSNGSNRAAYDTKEGPCLELSLKQIRSVTDIGISAQECNKLRHSDLSAFLRYNKSKISNQAPTGHVGSCSPVDHSSEAAKTESMRNLVSSSSGTPNARSNGSSNNNDMGSTTNNVSTNPEVVVDRAMPKSTVNNHHSPALKPVQHGNTTALQPVSGSRANATNQKIQVQHHHHHYHHHHHHVHNSQQQQQLNGDGLSSMDIIAKAPHHAPSDNIFGATTEVNATTEGNATNYGSASGSNNGSCQKGSTGKNGSSTGIEGEGKNVTSDNGEAGPCGPGGGIGRVVDQDRLAWREAALNKFQQKRKERCFEKKVRYQSRKQLADQRPRVRGQFVRQTDNESKRKNKTKDADS